MLDTRSMTVQLTPVEIATADGNEVVVSSGIAPGMQVVSAGVHVLQPGQKVTLYQAKRVDAGAAPASVAAAAK